MNSLVWFRLDLRLADNPALAAAEECRGEVVPVFIWSPEAENAWPPGAASRWWLHQSLAALDANLRARGSRLILRRGPALETLRALVRETGAGAVLEPPLRAGSDCARLEGPGGVAGRGHAAGEF